MRFREWFQDARQPVHRDDPPSPGELEHLRQVGRELLTAGQAAIDKALSGDSERFLAATRQEGGQ